MIPSRPGDLHYLLGWPKCRRLGVICGVPRKQRRARPSEMVGKLRLDLSHLFAGRMGHLCKLQTLLPTHQPPHLSTYIDSADQETRTSHPATMPRRSLAGSSSSTPLRTPSVDPTASISSPSSARLTRSTRATSTPRPTSASSSVPHGDAHHHLTADGLARIEAEKLMATPTNSRLGTPESSRKASSARDQRHLRLLQSREKLARARSEDGEDSADEDDGEEAEDDSAGLTTATLDGETIEMASSTSSRNEEQDEGAQRRKRNGLDDTAMTQDGTSQSAASETSHAEIESNDGTEKGERVIDGDLSNVSTTIPNDFGSSNVFHEDVASDNGEGSADSDEDAESSSGGSSSDESDSDSDGESDSETSASEDDEEEASDSDEEEERLEMLLQAARISALAKQQGKPDPKKSAGESEVVLQFDEEKKEA